MCPKSKSELETHNDESYEYVCIGGSGSKGLNSVSRKFWQKCQACGDAQLHGFIVCLMCGSNPYGEVPPKSELAKVGRKIGIKAWDDVDDDLPVDSNQLGSSGHSSEPFDEARLYMQNRSGETVLVDDMLSDYLWGTGDYQKDDYVTSD